MTSSFFSARRLRSALALAAGVLAWTSANAGRPFTTEDAGVIAQGSCELEVVQAYQRARGAESERATSAQLGCGAGANTQLALAYARNRAGAQRWPSYSIVGKTAARAPRDGDLGVALVYAATFEKLPGRSNEFTTALLNLVGTEMRGATAFHGNLGIVRDRVADESTVTWAFAVEQTGDRLDYGLEAFGAETRSAFVGAALRFAALPARLMFDASYAVQTNSGREKRITVGLKAVF